MAACFAILYMFWFVQKGFPLDADLDNLMAFFEKFGATELVQMRRNKKKEFKVNSIAVCAVLEYVVWVII